MPSVSNLSTTAIFPVIYTFRYCRVILIIQNEYNSTVTNMHEILNHHICCTKKNNETRSISQAKSGKAFLFSQAKNIVEGPKEQKLLITGIFKTADIHCSICDQVLGWKYLKAYDIKQKFKEGKFIIERAKIVKEYN